MKPLYRTANVFINVLFASYKRTYVFRALVAYLHLLSCFLCIPSNML